MINNSEILDFINRRFSNTDANWLHGNCYWFARMLKDRFDFLNIYYEPIDGHFVAGYKGSYFDYQGEYKLKSELYSLDWIKNNEPNWYKRLEEDCIK